MCWSSGMLSSSAPRSMSERLTPAANSFWFHFFLTDSRVTELMSRPLTRATAVTRPVSSSQARMTWAIWQLGSTPKSKPWEATALMTSGEAPFSSNHLTITLGCCSGNFSQSASWIRPAICHCSLSAGEMLK